MLRLGFDIGGTNIAAGLVEDGRIVGRASAAFCGPGAGDAFYGQLLELYRELLGAKEPSDALECIGIAVPGSVDRGEGRVIAAHNLGFYDVPLRAEAQRLFGGVPVHLLNDASAAVLAEHGYGALKGCACGVVITLGTGVGGGMIVNNRLWEGGLGNGTEIGHMILSHGGERCSCGNRGCAEMLCSARALAREGLKAAAAHPDSMLARHAAGPGGLDAKRVIDCARAGDGAALMVFERYVDALGSLLASVINLMDPEIIAIGGGVSGAGPFLIEPVKRNVHEKAFFQRHAKIAAAELGNDAGMIGAAMIERYG